MFSDQTSDPMSQVQKSLTQIQYWQNVQVRPHFRMLDFLQYIWQKNLAHFPVVVLYTGESCAFCQVASHVFQTLKGLISSDLVEFVSVDASANDLPWAFTALAVPSVLYFHPNSGSSTSSKPKAQQDQGMEI